MLLYGYSMIKLLFTYPEALPHETRLIKNLMQEEWDFLHVNKPDYNKDELINFLELIPELHHKVVLHNHFDLIHDFDVAGINLSRSDLNNLSFEDELTSACDLRYICIKNNKVEVNGIQPDLVSFMGDTYNEINHIPFQTDYVILFPIFEQPLKTKGRSNAINDPEILKFFLAETNKKVIALGGINNDRIHQCEALGFDGYAMLGAIWEKYFTFIETIQ